MARRIKGRWVIEGVLVARDPLHIGGMGEEAGLDLARDGAGEYYVPGTSLAGAFRSWLEERLGEREVNRCWGYQPAKGSKRDGEASWIFVEDAGLESGTLPEFRDGVGIDREWGAAADKVKYDFAVLPRGTRLTVQIVVEIPPSQEREEILRTQLALLIQELEEERVYLGAQKTRGLGRVKMKSARILHQDFSTQQGIVSVLRSGGTPLSWEDFCDTGSRSVEDGDELVAEVELEPEGPLMVRAAGEGSAVDSLPLVGGREDGKEGFVIPGASIKGVLRFQAERIVRTVLNRDLPKKDHSTRRFLEQVKVPLVEYLFGSAKPAEGWEKSKGNEETAGGPLPGLGALAADDVWSRNSWPMGMWSKVAASTQEDQLIGALKDLGLSGVQQAFHVAVDRWTGGAADGFLFSEMELHGAQWETIRLRVRWRRIPVPLRMPAAALFLLLLQDFASGKITVGHGANRGMGDVKVSRVRLKGKVIPTPPDEMVPSAKEAASATEGVLKEPTSLEFTTIADLPGNAADGLRQAWRVWVRGEVAGE